VVPHESPSQWASFVYRNRYAISLRLGARRFANFGVLGVDPQIEEEVGLESNK
jgi:hypothetical protein